jgi:N-acetylglucosamine-6-phosphate deacetylase
VAAVGLHPAGRGTAVPGFVDLQVNGYAGVDFLTADAPGWHEAARALARDGVTSFLPTLITAPREKLLAALARAARLGVPGVHLEGPFISERRIGAHPRASRRDPDLALMRELLDAGPVAMVTLAPELPGADALIAELTGRGVIVSLGHSAATAEEAAEAVVRGARCVTHVFNAMGGIWAREPGLAGFALGDPRVTVLCIADGVHLHDATLRVVAAAARKRLVLTTDAVADEGRATLADGTLAGGLGTLAEAVRRLVSLGVPLPDAVDAASGAPARLLGREDVGTLRPGARADVVVLDDDLAVRQVLVAGQPVRSSP